MRLSFLAATVLVGGVGVGLGHVGAWGGCTWLLLLLALRGHHGAGVASHWVKHLREACLWTTLSHWESTVGCHLPVHLRRELLLEGGLLLLLWVVSIFSSHGCSIRVHLLVHLCHLHDLLLGDEHTDFLVGGCRELLQLDSVSSVS